MKLIIAGGRDHELVADDYKKLLDIPDVDEIVSGGCPTGVDSCGETWASVAALPVKQFPADWKAHGKAAGPIRNRQMAEYADAVALFPGGRGTASMHAEALAAGIVVYDFRVPPSAAI